MLKHKKPFFSFQNKICFSIPKISFYRYITPNKVCFFIADFFPVDWIGLIMHASNGLCLGFGFFGFGRCSSVLIPVFIVVAGAWNESEQKEKWNFELFFDLWRHMYFKVCCHMPFKYTFAQLHRIDVVLNLVWTNYHNNYKNPTQCSKRMHKPHVATSL